MALRGARNLILLSRTGGNTEDARSFLRDMHALGVKVSTPICDIGDKDSVASVLAGHQHCMPPVKGCIQSSMVLAVRSPLVDQSINSASIQMLICRQDSLFENMTLKTFETATKPKVEGSWSLHQLLPRGLDFFILLSSTSAIGGARGQANYTAGNTYQDSVAHHRVCLGEKAVTLNLGWVTDTGYITDRPHLVRELKRLGLPSLSKEDVMSLLEYYCNPALPLLSPSKCQVIVGLETPANLRAQNIEQPYWMRKSQFRALHSMDRTLNTIPSNVGGTNEYTVTLRNTESVKDASNIILEAFVKKLSNMMGLGQEDIDPARLLTSYGVDSLVAIEIRNWIHQELHVEVKVFELSGSETILELCQSTGEKAYAARTLR